MGVTSAERRFELRRGDGLYPAQLEHTVDPPDVLYGIGDPHCLVEGLAIVGARKCTPYGIGAASLFGSWAAASGYAVVSGAAVGCDQAAHRAALDSEGITVAVLGCGADVVYPSGSGPLLERIAASGGAVVSELEWGTTPRRWAFRRRNRIIAGLSAALLVVEARLPSGTFSTAEYALDAGREVLAVPGSIEAPECRGPNRLIRQGATPVTDVSDLAFELERLIGPPVRRVDPVAGRSDMVTMLEAALTATPMRPDDAAIRLGEDIVSIARCIGELEAQGLVFRYPDGRYGTRPGRR